MRKHWSLACALAVAGSLLITSPASAASNINTEPLRDAVKGSNITEHLAALEAIANANPFEGVPTRATGTPGHVKSVDYVVERMKAAGFTVTQQPFQADVFIEESADFEQTLPSPINFERYDGVNGVWYPAEFSGDGNVTENAVVVDFTEPTRQASASDSGCQAEDFVGLGVEGKVVLLQRGTCDFGLKAVNAAAAGAAAAVIFNEGTIGAPDRKRCAGSNPSWISPTGLVLPCTFKWTAP
jgi:hypothetical protein